MIETIFEKLGLTSQEPKLYLALLESGPTSAGLLAKKSGTRRSTLYGLLENLQGRGLVSQTEKNGVKIWRAEPPETISNSLRRKSEEWKKTNEDFNILLPELLKKQRQDTLAPRFKYFHGIDGVKHIMNDMLLYSDMITQSFWPASEMLDLLGEDFFDTLNRARIRQRLYTQALWPPSKAVNISKHPSFGVGKEFFREIRLTPKGVDCTMGYWAYHTKVAFVSSRKECFGFIVESNELRQMLKTQFDVLWEISEPIKVPKKALRKFLSTI